MECCTCVPVKLCYKRPLCGRYPSNVVMISPFLTFLPFSSQSQVQKWRSCIEAAVGVHRRFAPSRTKEGHGTLPAHLPRRRYAIASASLVKVCSRGQYKVYITYSLYGRIMEVISHTCMCACYWHVDNRRTQTRTIGHEIY